MRKLIFTSLLAATAAIATPAAATPGLVFTPNVYVTDEPGAVFLFGQYETAPASAGGTAYVKNTAPTATTPGEKTTGSVLLFTNGTVNPSESVDPTKGSNTGNYLSVAEGTTAGSYTVTFATPVQYFSFATGTIDNYNVLTLVDTLGAVFTYTGQQIAGFPTIGTQNSEITGLVEFYFGGGPGLVSATFSSSSAAFEIDNLSTAVPEPAAWAMMIVGFGAAGGALRSARRRTARDKGLATA